MRIDAQLAFATALAITATGDATNVIDLGVARGLADGRPLSVFINVDVAADSTTGNETYQFSVTTDDNAALTSDTTIATATILAAALAINTLHEIPLPQLSTIEQFLGLVATLGGTTPTITYTAWLGESGSLPSTKTYPNGYDTV